MKTSSASIEIMVRGLSPAEVQAGVERLLLVDVSTPAEYEESHIEGAILRPISEMEVGEVARLAEGKEACVLICRSGGRAKKAAEKLLASGMTNLCILEGGLQAWMREDLPLNRGEKMISLERQVRIGAGGLVLAGAVLSFLLHPAWILLSGFVGAGLIFAGITDTCGMGMLLARMPWNTKRKTG